MGGTWGEVRSCGWGLQDGIGALIRTDTGELLLVLSLPREDTARRQPSASQETCSQPNHAGCLNSDFQSPELGENTCLVVKLPSIWYLVVAA